jgi:hypothetical protein
MDDTASHDDVSRTRPAKSQNTESQNTLTNKT